MAPPSIRVLIVDDDPHFLDAVDALLARAEDIQVIARAENGEDALRKAAQLLPDAITMDIDMPLIDGIEATRMIVHYFHVAVVLLTASDSSDRVAEGLDAGAAAHVTKSRAWEDLVPTLRAAVAEQPRQ